MENIDLLPNRIGSAAIGSDGTIWYSAVPGVDGTPKTASLEGEIKSNLFGGEFKATKPKNGSIFNISSKGVGYTTNYHGTICGIFSDNRLIFAQYDGNLYEKSKNGILTQHTPGGPIFHFSVALDDSVWVTRNENGANVYRTTGGANDYEPMLGAAWLLAPKNADEFWSVRKNAKNDIWGSLWHYNKGNTVEINNVRPISAAVNSEGRLWILDDFGGKRRILELEETPDKWNVIAPKTVNGRILIPIDGNSALVINDDNSHKVYNRQH